MNSRRPMVRRREGDEDWLGAKRRTPWDGPTSEWGEDVNTRLDRMDIALFGSDKDDPGIVQMTQEMYALFKKSKSFGLAFIAVLAFLGWTGITQIVDWFRIHLK